MASTESSLNAYGRLMTWISLAILFSIVANAPTNTTPLPHLFWSFLLPRHYMLLTETTLRRREVGSTVEFATKTRSRHQQETPFSPRPTRQPPSSLPPQQAVPVLYRPSLAELPIFIHVEFLLVAWISAKIARKDSR